MTKVVIGIQARSTSKRFPAKVFEEIDNKEILQHIIDSAERCAIYLNKFGSKNDLDVRVITLIPKGDMIKDRYKFKTVIFEGPEDDVLKRYIDMAKETKATHIVRITSDCPLLPSFIITKHINVALAGGYDYVSNVDENFRTAIDGHDCEVISLRALEWASLNAQDSYEREHVTPILRSNRIPKEFKTAHIIGHVSQKHIKLSIDNSEDLERVRKEYDEIKKSIENAKKKHGKESVHRI